MSPQSEQTASTSSNGGCGSGSEWTNLFKDNHIPIPYNDIQNPRQLLGHLIPNLDVKKLPATLDDFDICRLVFQLMNSDGASHPHLSDLFIIQRDKLKEYNTLEQAVELIDRSKNIIVLTGAGCSVSCGIPDFRSRDGVYARLRVDFPDLPDPQAMKLLTSHQKCTVLHAVLNDILEPLRQASHGSLTMKDPSGTEQEVVPFLYAYVTDYPESSKVTATYSAVNCNLPLPWR